MDEMDYEMQHPGEPSTPQAQQLPAPQGCPAWRGGQTPTAPSGTSQSPGQNPALGSSARRPTGHTHFDPVHSSSGPWPPQQATSFQWPAPSLPPAPAPLPYPTRLPPADLYHSTLQVSGGGGHPGIPSGPVQPALNLSPHPHAQFSHDPFTSYQFFRAPAVSSLPPQVPRLGPSSASGSQPPMNLYNPERPGQNPGHRSGVVSLPSVSQALHAAPSMSNPADSSNLGPGQTPSLRNVSASRSLDSARGPGRGVASAGSSTTTSPSRPVGTSHPPRPVSLFGGDSSVVILPTTPPVPPNTERRHLSFQRARGSMATVQSQQSDYDSDEDLDGLDDEHDALRIIEQFTVASGFPVRAGADMDEERVRAQQLLRGQLSSKRVASRSAISSLQSVEISSLPESERTCVICYNEFGVPNPEGINEAPLRLPKCKHVFGDHCIKKWFEESDSCPYCRDKVPSEPQLRSGHHAIREMLRVMGPRGFGLPGGAVRPGTTSYAPMMRDPEIRYVRYEGSPTRNWQTGERRSPPSEASDNRRRTRPRYGSFTRGSPPSVTVSHQSAPNPPNNPRPNSFAGFAGVSPSQHSPVRERMPPGHSRPGPYNSRPHHTTVPPYLGVDGVTAPPAISSPGHHPSINPSPLMMNTAAQDQPYANPLNVMVGPPIPPGGLFPGPSAMAAAFPPPNLYHQQQQHHHRQHAQAVGTSEGPGFPSLSSQANSQPVSNAESW